MKEFGKACARQVIWDAQTLAKALDAVGFPVACSDLGYTQSHQVFLDYGGYKQGRIVAQKLEKANIIVDCRVRVGVCEETRRGMKSEEILQIAEFMERVIRGKEKPSKVKRDVAKFMKDFQKVEYYFEQ